eukprot:GHVS01052100.1.p1 GENE.GHVS01052100.1~~GHVS01052100.1.p1  ORF type:complete len:355 (-),score=59.37 GHVS01052100.1:359-1360(-)
MSPQSSSRLVISFLLLLPLLICLSFVTAADLLGNASPVGQSTNYAEAQPGDSSVTASSVEETASRVDGTASSVGRTVGQINPMPSEVTASTTTEVESVENGAAELLRSNVGISMRGNVGPEAFGDLIESVDVRPAQSEESDAMVPQAYSPWRPPPPPPPRGPANEERCLIIQYDTPEAFNHRTLFNGVFGSFGEDVEQKLKDTDQTSAIDVEGLTYYSPSVPFEFNEEGAVSGSGLPRSYNQPVWFFPRGGQDDTVPLTDNQKSFFTHFYANIKAMADVLEASVSDITIHKPKEVKEGIKKKQIADLEEIFRLYPWPTPPMPDHLPTDASDGW